MPTKDFDQSEDCFKIVDQQESCGHLLPLSEIREVQLFFLPRELARVDVYPTCLRGFVLGGRGGPEAAYFPAKHSCDNRSTWTKLLSNFSHN